MFIGLFGSYCCLSLLFSVNYSFNCLTIIESGVLKFLTIVPSFGPV